MGGSEGVGSRSSHTSVASLSASSSCSRLSMPVASWRGGGTEGGEKARGWKGGEVSGRRVSARERTRQSVCAIVRARAPASESANRGG